MRFFQAYMANEDGRCEDIGELRLTAAEAKQDLIDAGYKVDDLEFSDFGVGFSRKQNVGISVTRV